MEGVPVLPLREIASPAGRFALACVTVVTMLLMLIAVALPGNPAHAATIRSSIPSAANIMASDQDWPVADEGSYELVNPSDPHDSVVLIVKVHTGQPKADKRWWFLDRIDFATYRLQPGRNGKPVSTKTTVCSQGFINLQIVSSYDGLGPYLRGVMPNQATFSRTPPKFPKPINQSLYAHGTVTCPGYGTFQVWVGAFGVGQTH